MLFIFTVQALAATDSSKNRHFVERIKFHFMTTKFDCFHCQLLVCNRQYTVNYKFVNMALKDELSQWWSTTLPSHLYLLKLFTLYIIAMQSCMHKAHTKTKRVILSKKVHQQTHKDTCEKLKRGASLLFFPQEENCFRLRRKLFSE